MALAQTRLHARAVERLLRRAPAHALRTLCTAEHGGLESCPMNEFGEPNMGNPSVRFDEGRESVGHWPSAFQPILSRLLHNLFCPSGFEVAAGGRHAKGVAPG